MTRKTAIGFLALFVLILVTVSFFTPYADCQAQQPASAGSELAQAATPKSLGDATPRLEEQFGADAAAKAEMRREIDAAIKAHNVQLVDTLFDQYVRIYGLDVNLVLAYQKFIVDDAGLRARKKEYRSALDRLVLAYGLVAGAAQHCLTPEEIKACVHARTQIAARIRAVDDGWRQEAEAICWTHITAADELWRNSKSLIWDSEGMQRQAVRELAQVAPSFDIMPKEQAEKYWEVSQRLKDELGEKEFFALCEQYKKTDRPEALYPVEPEQRPWEALKA